jgi:hypothetical protein
MEQTNQIKITKSEPNDSRSVDFSNLTDRGLLRFQLEQLAEVSIDCMPEELPDITSSMIDIVAYLENNEEYKKGISRA